MMTARELMFARARCRTRLEKLNLVWLWLRESRLIIQIRN